MSELTKESLEEFITSNKESGFYPNSLLQMRFNEDDYNLLISEKLSLAMIKFLIIQEFEPKWNSEKILDKVTELNSAIKSSNSSQVILLLIRRI